MKKLSQIILLSSILSTQVMAAPKIIYGEDNRLDVFESTNALHVELARSTAAMVPLNGFRETQDGLVELLGQTLEERGMCETERFAKQTSAANCSGFLVGDDLLVTAGHCITGQSSCDSYAWVFDFAVESTDQTVVKVEKSSVSNCVEVVERALTYMNNDDYALIRLDRKVEDRRVLEIRQEGRPAIGDELVMIGNPVGMPTKITDGATVRSLSGKYFSADLDAFGGNSGSAVFNATTGVVEGILVRGGTDFVQDRMNGCLVSNVVGQDTGRGEDVTYITNIKALKK